MAIGKENQQAIPFWLASYLRPTDLQEISQAVSRAEAKTTGEIVPMVVERSSAVRHVGIVIGLLLFSIVMLLDLNLHWDFLDVWSLYMAPLEAILCYLTGRLLARHWTFQRFFTPDQDEAFQVAIRAELEFHRLNMEATSARTGILIFISMMERRVVVLADKGIALHLPANTWQNLVDNLVKRLKKKDLKTGLNEAIGVCGDLLAQKLPAGSHNNNEIANDLIIKA